MTIADRISELRRGRELSQEELAEMTGVSRQAVSKWESEQSIPEMDKIITLSEIFGVTTDYLLKGIEPLELRPERRNKPAKAFNIVATTLNAIGLTLAIFIGMAEVNEYYSTMTTGSLIGFIFIVLGLMVFMLGTTRISRKDQPSNGFRFWRVNVWIVAFFALSIIYNASIQQKFAAFPLPFYETEPMHVDTVWYRDPYGNEWSEEEYWYHGRYITKEEYEKLEPEETKTYPDWLKKGGGAAIFIVTYMTACAATTYILTKKDEQERLKRGVE